MQCTLTTFATYISFFIKLIKQEKLDVININESITHYFQNVPRPDSTKKKSLSQMINDLIFAEFNQTGKK